MKTYKPTFKDKRTGKTKKCSHWYLTFVDNRQTRRCLPSFTNKAATDRLGQKIDELLSSGGVLSQDLQQWLESLPDKMRDRLVTWGLIDSRRMTTHLGKSLADHLRDFEGALLAKGNGVRYCKQVSSQVGLIFGACGFRTFGDIDANAVYTYLSGLREAGIGQRTFNCYLGACKGFARWMIRERRASAPSPLEHLSPIKQTEKRRQRRALEVDELRRLIATTAEGPERFGMTGAERSLLYRVACETGLRANELRSLKVSSFDFGANTVTVEAAYSKRRRLDVLPVRAETAVELRAFFAGKTSEAKAFGGSFKQLTDKTSDLIKADLSDAGIEYCEDGRFFDFHSQRHETGTLLAASGVDVKTAQSLMRHSDVNLTMSIYAHTLRGSEARAIAKLPDLSAGTDRRDASVA